MADTYVPLNVRVPKSLKKELQLKAVDEECRLYQLVEKLLREGLAEAQE